VACLVLIQLASSGKCTFVHLVSLHHSVHHHHHQIVDDIKDVTVVVLKLKEVINKLIFLGFLSSTMLWCIGWLFVINYKLSCKTIPLMTVKTSVALWCKPKFS